MTFFSITDGVCEGVASHRIEHDHTTDGAQLTAGWTFADGRLEVFGDRLGLIPLFYWRGGGRLVVSDSIAEVVARVPSPRLDAPAVAVFLQLGFHTGENTPFEGVKTLPPGGSLRWNGTFTLKHPELPPHEPFTGSWEQAATRYVVLFEAAIARRAQLGVGRLTVSGGRDSRHILLELLRQGYRPPVLITQDRPVNTDLEVGRLLAARAGIEHIAITPCRDSLDDELTKNRWNHYLADENAWYLQIAEHLSGPIFDGLAGGMLSGTDMFRADELTERLRSADPRASARALLAAIGSKLDVLNPKFRLRWSQGVAVDALATQIARHRNAPNPLTSFLFWNRTRREIALIPLCIAARHAPVRLPYLDPPLMAFLSSLPHPQFSGTGFHDFVIERTYPDFRDIPYGTKRKRRSSFRQALRQVAAGLRFGANPTFAKSEVAKTVLATLVTADARPVAGWLYRALPIIQACAELGIDPAR